MSTCTPWSVALAATLSAFAAAAAPFTVSADGAEVTDQQTGLIWRRCTEGQSWSGSACTGTPKSFSHEQALAHARTQPGWRLPNIKELASIAPGSLSYPSIDRAAFLETPSWFYWSSTPYAGAPESAWFVFFEDGYTGVNPRRYFSYYARLVR